MVTEREKVEEHFHEGRRCERERIINLIKKKFINNIQFADNLIEDIEK